MKEGVKSPYGVRYQSIIKALDEELGMRRCIVIIEADGNGFDVLRKGLDNKTVRLILESLLDDPMYGEDV